MTLTVVL